MSNSSSSRAWAKRLLAEEATTSAPGSCPSPVVRVLQRLRAHLTRLIGADGFIALQRRALILARAEIPSLKTVRVTAEGDLEGLEALSDVGEAATAIIAHMLDLLFGFIGESLALRLMLEAFPHAPNPSIGEPENLS